MSLSLEGTDGGSNFSKQRLNFPHEVSLTEWVFYISLTPPPTTGTPCYVDTIHHSIRAEYMFYHAFIDSIMKTHVKYCHFLHHDVKKISVFISYLHHSCMYGPLKCESFNIILRWDHFIPVKGSNFRTISAVMHQP